MNRQPLLWRSRARTVGRLTILVIILPLMGFTFLDGVAEKNREGNRLFGEGKFEEAVQYYLEAQAENPETLELRYNLGDAFYRQEAYDKALQEFKRALESRDKTLLAKSYYNIGNVNFRQKRLGEAAEAYKRSLELDPDDLDAKINLELTLERLEAITHAKGLKEKAEALIKQRRFQDAYDLMIEGLRVNAAVGVYRDFIRRIKDILDIEKGS